MYPNQGYIIWPSPPTSGGGRGDNVCVCVEGVGTGGAQYIDESSSLSYLFEAQMPVKRKEFQHFSEGGGAICWLAIIYTPGLNLQFLVNSLPSKCMYTVFWLYHNQFLKSPTSGLIFKACDVFRSNCRVMFYFQKTSAMASKKKKGSTRKPAAMVKSDKVY